MKSLRPGGGWKGNVGTMSAMPKCLLAENQMLTRTDDTPDINDALKWVDVPRGFFDDADERRQTHDSTNARAFCHVRHAPHHHLRHRGRRLDAITNVLSAESEDGWKQVVGEMRDRHLRGDS